ncbi:MAG: helix-turn-helix domain-containing protein [Erysipelotrichaceae bacterium]|jgi:repressor LexA|uniref:Helix-turn-helix domain-containing protein n=1 Tax=Grylomicrobium aquisgranensis TaxID=2926318 RepID=A0AB35U248_9FIRM|nr:helix-turn-helix domain-containing protein [Erysipelotrichaceae bacterium]MCI1327276.1 helix-turn-helix domain-containing protein [Solobacterium sp.]MDX8418646.1 helix-turn-helix domain-containing protein [Stecheria sp. CLA-KB-P133]MCH4044734.1 helix-turn-helix domain-containing protein [Erysipelotrichaceae bacterium]MCH4121946.1 helix-turn-helix domain-containing protein [Erysipelotrichaceae bacterium]
MSDLGNKEVMSKNIKRLLKEHHKTRSDLSAAINVPYTTVSDWVNAKKYPRIDKIEMMANYFGVSKSVLVEKESALISPPVLRIPLYDMISCGTGGFVDDQIIDYVVLPVEMFSPSKEYFAQYAHGDSMIGANIHGGDLIIFEKQSEPVNGMIGCFCIDDNTATCKRLSISGTQIILLPENPAYTPIIVPVESFKCLGKLAFVVSDRRDS